MADTNGWDDDEEVDLLHEVDAALAQIDFKGMAASLARTAADVAQELGLARRDPSPYIICERDALLRGTGEIAGGLMAGLVALPLLTLGISFAAAGLRGPGIVAIVLGALAGWGAKTLVGRGVGRRRMTKLLKAMSDELGDTELITLRELAGRVEVTQDRLRPLVSDAIDRGFIPQGHLGMLQGAETLFLSSRSWDEAHVVRDESCGTEDVLGACASFVRSVRAVGERIEDMEARALLGQIAARVEGITAYVRAHPQTASRMRRVASYYLPTTLKLADSFAELESHGAQSVTARTILGELKGTFKQVGAGLSKLSDELLTEQSWDLAGDMSVMRTMLEQDGLVDDGGALRPRP
ncbi:5-bromo-4-chloroindolyl phosphate hydrolysis family protein [Olsenella sp. HMSC062G07]|uniref:5-bromo-4-chloroindolyl phosphate hydrolysis family protein n=1 Tax=Olsenella sp. HMSC062G07 TaxID=1739330 RepID=UPI0008A4F405|nr:5-bromo-4-chloroindolyl phosphate hydrolysis family protein [Olsenella sp. HMSC062G07]OFK24610.1 hypothetical protein HMPREF2826_06850 [Olsenella sp. HMSC062G07]